MYPTDLRYTNDHEWVRKASDGALTVGITAFAAKQLGEVVFVELPPLAMRLDSGEAFGTIESVKAVSELYAPVGGEIAGVNEELSSSPELVNDDPYGDGWLVKLKPSDAKELDALKTAVQYEEFLAEDD